MVRSLENARLFRHYTIANCMVPEIYHEIIRVLKFRSNKRNNHVSLNSYADKEDQITEVENDGEKNELHEQLL